MADDSFRRLIECGDSAAIRTALEMNPALVNQTIHWHLNQDNESDPLHYVSDSVAQGWLTNGKEGEIAELMLAHGAAINGTKGRESPLIASASLGAERVAKVLILAGAEIEATSVFGARALHWAAWMGLPKTVELLVAHGAEIEPKCQEFGATPLFWAVHGFGPHGAKEKGGQVKAARILIKAGAKLDTVNKQGLSALEMSKLCPSDAMYKAFCGTE